MLKLNFDFHPMEKIMIKKKEGEKTKQNKKGTKQKNQK